jgi:hypothetical protein
MRASAGAIRQVDGIGHAPERLDFLYEVTRFARYRRNNLGGDDERARSQTLSESNRIGSVHGSHPQTLFLEGWLSLH